VSQRFLHEVEGEEEFEDADLVIAADGINSKTPQTGMRPYLNPRSIPADAASSGWAPRSHSPAFTFAFERTEHGWFQIHAYQFSKDLSTVIVETREETWRRTDLTGSTRRSRSPSASNFSVVISAATGSKAMPDTCADRRG